MQDKGDVKVTDIHDDDDLDLIPPNPKIN